jgi:hypothetical protein
MITRGRVTQCSELDTRTLRDPGIRAITHRLPSWSHTGHLRASDFAASWCAQQNRRARGRGVAFNQGASIVWLMADGLRRDAIGDESPAGFVE